MSNALSDASVAPAEDVRGPLFPQLRTPLLDSVVLAEPHGPTCQQRLAGDEHECKNREEQGSRRPVAVSEGRFAEGLVVDEIGNRVAGLTWPTDSKRDHDSKDVPGVA